MASKSSRFGLIVVFLLTGGFAAPAWAQGPGAPQLLTYRPKMDGVNYSTPARQDQAACKVENLRNAQNKTMGWKVIDPHGQTLRCFLDTTGSGRINVWQYYKDGMEVYREIDTKGTERPDQFRWLNDGGMKWGIDLSGRGKIDAWRAISSEEVGQEAFQALVTRDFDRLQALFITEADMRSLRLSDREAARIKGQLAHAREKFLATAATVQGGRFKQVEAAIPSCVAGDTLGMDTDLIHFPTRAVLYEVAGGKQHTWVQTGEMIQVGSNWRLADAPGDAPTPVEGNRPTHAPEEDRILKLIAAIDVQTGKPGSAAETKRLVDRVRLIGQLLTAMQAQDPQRETWYKQLVDNLQGAAAGGDNTALGQLSAMADQLGKARPGSEMHGYVKYRELCAIYLVKLSQNLPRAELEKVQKEWQEALTKFVQTFPKTEDTADALRYLAVGAEFAGRDAEAKRWYEQIYVNFPNHHLAETARGSVRRLDCVGQPMELSGPMLNGARNFDVGELKGKVVAVYYWARYCEQVPNEFRMLKDMQSTYGSKGFEVVCINLDDEQAAANSFLSQVPAPGIHLFQQGKGGGLNSPLATHYGVNGLPTLFLIDRQGRVITRTLQVRDLDEALRRAL